MGAAKLAVLSLTLLLGLSAAANPPAAAAPAPAVDCMTIQFGLADCVSFVSNGTNETMPSKSCCKGLKNALIPDAAAAQICLCQGFQESHSLGIDLNFTNSKNLPTLCHVNNFSVDKCQLGPAAAPGPSGTPVISPSGAPPPTDSSVPGAAPPPPTASSVPGTAPTASSVPSGANAVSPNVAPSSQSTSTSSRLGGSVELLVSTAIFAAFLTSYS